MPEMELVPGPRPDVRQAPLLQADGLVRHYGVRGAGWFGAKRTLRAVDGVSFQLNAKRTLGLVGESGCGKSTTAKLVLGLVPPTRGEARFEGRAVPFEPGAEWRELRRRMQLVFQDPLGALDRRIPVGRQVMEPLAVHGLARGSAARDQAMALFASVGLRPDLFERYPHELSGGQRQRVVLARALILEPALLVCDEPISALDVSIQAQVITLLAEIQARMGVAFLFISHDLKVVRQISDEVAVMYLGKIVEQGHPDRVLLEPAHPYTSALVSAVPTPRTRGRPRLLLEGDPPSPIDLPTGCSFQSRCPVARATCAELEPALKPLRDGHLVACHVAHGEAAAAPLRKAA